jgi:NAD(P)H-hydrate epimerase
VTLSGDAGTSWRKLEACGIEPVTVTSAAGAESLSATLTRADLVIDGLFGTGFTGTTAPPASLLIEAINRSGAPVLALDVPSGVDSETGRVGGNAVCASVTSTFGLPKLGLVFYPARALAGEIRVIDIGIREALWRRVGSRTHLVTSQTAEADLPIRRPDAHKGDCGRVTIVGGSPGLTGAVVLASNAALRAGAGLVTAAVPAGLQDLVAGKLTEVMTRALTDTPERTLAANAASQLLELPAGKSAFAVGPGLSRAEGAAEAARRLALELPVPTVVDADGLNAFEGAIDRLAGARGSRVITPHFGEAARLLQRSADELSATPLDTARTLASRSGAVTVLKGAPTVIATPEGEVYINTTGNAGLATGGTGDVLTGLIAGFLAQGCEPVAAARLGVYVHGLAGDLGAGRLTQWGLVAGDVVGLIPEALSVTSSGGDDAWIS